MGEWTTLSVQSGTKDRFNELKNDADQSANELLTELMDAWEGRGKYDTELALSYDKTGLSDEELAEVQAAFGDGELQARDIYEGIGASAGGGVDAELVEELSKRLGSDVEMSAYRGARDAIEEATK